MEAEPFPIGFWNGMRIEKLDVDAVADWADAGMTLAMSPEFGALEDETLQMHRLLEAAEDRGIRVILCHDATHWRRLAKVGEEAYRHELSEAVRAFHGFPAVFGFHVGDEPGKEEFETACRAMRIHKEVAPDLSPFLNLLPWYPGVASRVGYPTWPAYLAAYLAKAGPDVLCYDYYGQMNPLGEKWDQYGDAYFTNLREFGDAAKQAGIPFWTTLLSVGHFDYRCPKEDDFRWQLNTAVAHGAKGILWFYFYMGQPPYVNYRVSPIDEHWERTETFGWMSRVNRTFLKRFGSVVVGLDLQRVSHAGKAWGGVPAFDGTTGLVSAFTSSHRTPLIISEFKQAGRRDAIMVVNNSQTQNTFAGITIRGAERKIARIAWEGREEAAPCCGVMIDPVDGGVAVSQWMAPGQMELYMLD